MTVNAVGRVNSFQSLGASDGPGIRFVVFMQGCNLRCGCCHNPDTWDTSCGKTYTAIEVTKRAYRFKEYFGSSGGITVSGGEPLLQSKFVRDLFFECKNLGINTCLDTSGVILTDDVKDLLRFTDTVLLDVKYSDSESYQKYVGCDIKKPLLFLSYLNECGIKTVLRRVIIPTLNDNEESVLELKNLAKQYPCVENVELLPFKKLCSVKYDNLGIDFPFRDIPEPSKELMNRLKSLLCN